MTAVIERTCADAIGNTVVACRSGDPDAEERAVLELAAVVSRLLAEIRHLHDAARSAALN